MANTRYRLIAGILLVTAVVTGSFGAYFLMAGDNFTLGVILLVVAVSDFAMALFFSQRA